MLSVVVAMMLVGMTPAKAAGPSYAHPWNQPDCPCATVLHEGSAAEAGFVPQALDDIDGSVSRALARRVAPGAVVLVARRGVIAKWQAYGYASLYKNGDYALADDPRPMQKDEIFDMASVSKLFTAVAIMQLWDEGKFKLDDPVAKYLPQFGVHGKEDVTIRQLLTHTSGFRPDPPTPLYEIKGSRKDRLDYVLQLPLEHPPGTHYVYSDINFITLGALIEKLSGEREDVFIRKHLTGPLHMTDTMYDPPADLKPRIAATEYQPWTHRGMLWGQVDDENAWALGGVAGHAGVFGTARDLAVFGQMVLNGGSYDGARVLSQRAVDLLLTDWNKKFPGDAIGLGWSIDQPWYQGALAGPHTAGHEGFTGTALTINTRNDIVTVVLTNRVHPNRNGPSSVTALHHINTGIANAIPVVPSKDSEAWFSGYGDYLNRTLTATVESQSGATLSFRTWYRLQDGDDYGSVEASPDGVHWQALGLLTGSSDGWQIKTMDLPSNTRYIQFRYRTDEKINGRGWYVDDLQIHAGGKTTQPKITDNQWQQRDY
ncbi:MAG TPA: serine hydrolase [Rhodanobacteraceae bacterium]|nr:serine hydrolase [Rhodanobacteraceae bacterium]